MALSWPHNRTTTSPHNLLYVLHKPGVLGLIPGDCWPFHFPLFCLITSKHFFIPTWGKNSNRKLAWLRPGNNCCSILCAPGPLGQPAAVKQCFTISIIVSSNFHLLYCRQMGLPHKHCFGLQSNFLEVQKYDFRSKLPRFTFPYFSSFSMPPGVCSHWTCTIWLKSHHSRSLRHFRSANFCTVSRSSPGPRPRHQIFRARPAAYFSTRPQGAREKFGVWGRDYTVSGTRLSRSRCS